MKRRWAFRRMRAARRGPTRKLRSDSNSRPSASQAIYMPLDYAGLGVSQNETRTAWNEPDAPPSRSFVPAAEAAGASPPRPLIIRFT